MKTLKVLVGALLVVSGLGLFVSTAGAAPAEKVDDQGWWWRLQQGLPVPAPPDVGEDQLLVEASPEGATALAAVRVTLENGHTNPILTLTESSATGAADANLLACQTGSGWTGAHGGEWASKPNADCAQSVQGIREEAQGGATWSFNLGALQFGRTVDVVLVAGKRAEDPSVQPFRIVFEGVTTADVSTTSGGASPAPGAFTPAPPPTISNSQSPSPAPATGGGSTGGGSFSPAPSSGGSSFAGPSDSGGSFSVPTTPSEESLAEQPVQAALPAEDQGLTATAPVLQASSAPGAVPASSEGSNAARWLAVLVTLVGGALMVWANRGEEPAERGLSRFAGPREGPVPSLR